MGTRLAGFNQSLLESYLRSPLFIFPLQQRASFIHLSDKCDTIKKINIFLEVELKIFK